jgi:hypothetical protein
VDQKSDGDKMLFLDVNGNSNNIDILQQGTGEHFLDVTLGSNQTMDITQDGSGDHAATIDMRDTAQRWISVRVDRLTKIIHSTQSAPIQMDVAPPPSISSNLRT